MVTVPNAFPKDFRRDVVAVARRGKAAISQIAKELGISESCLQRWLKIADVEDGVKLSMTQADQKKRTRLLKQEHEILRKEATYLSPATLPK
jgi:transposase